MAMVAALALATAQGAPSAPNVAYPDLGMARLSSLSLLTQNGQVQLRFSATIVNVGAGPLELSATRNDATSAFTVSQRVYGAGGSDLLPTPGAELVWGGDGHSHWHVKGLETYELNRLDNGVKVGTSAKSGFCFFDTASYSPTLPGAPSSAVYRPATVCGANDVAAADVTMGLSVGWGDTYPWNLPDQYIDITALSSGKYRLVATADPNHWFTETRTSNNATWVDISLTMSRKNARMKILGYGPAA
jgi:Lysyl oxidase